jgi:hypothetical protein
MNMKKIKQKYARILFGSTALFRLQNRSLEGVLALVIL